MKRLPSPGPDEGLLLTANRLLDGRIVWRSLDGAWHESIAEAACLPRDEAERALEEAQTHEQRDKLVGIYAVLAKMGRVPVPVSMRERIRATGPTVHPEFAYPTPSEERSDEREAEKRSEKHLERHHGEDAR